MRVLRAGGGRMEALGPPQGLLVSDRTGKLLFSKLQCPFRTGKEAAGKFCEERALLERCLKF